MLAMAVDAAAHRLQLVGRPVPQPGPGEVLLRVRACGVCRTDLHIIDGELPAHREAVDLHAAPLLCAGLIGFRTWRLAGGAHAQRIGAAHPRARLSPRAGERCDRGLAGGTDRGRRRPRALIER
jgi:D-arabinose 1-dehydrogenase-like Zn-dependent alcohol dehydrogenase